MSDNHLDEAMGHLSAILMQEAPSDDRIIMDHVRAAYVLLKELQWQQMVEYSRRYMHHEDAK